MIKVITAITSLLSVIVLMLTGCDNDMYTFAQYGPEPEKAYIFLYDGMSTGNMGGRDGIDDMCSDKYNELYSYLGAFEVKGFVSVSSDDQIRDLLPSAYWDTPVFGINAADQTTQIPVSSSWKNLWNTSTELENDLYTAIDIGASWWSGSSTTGTYGGNSCSGWTSDSGATGQIGDQSALDSTWIDNTTGDCSASYNVLCMAY